MDFLSKISFWFAKTGLTNICYLIAFFIVWILGYKFLAGAALGIFVYINWNVIKKLVTNKLHKI